MLQRAAIYARFSSDRQNERSCEDQVYLCTAWAAQQGLTVIADYQDRAVSGASTINRIELGRMLRDARERRFDVIVCENLDRLSRDQADLARMKKELAFLDIGIMTVVDGVVGAMHIGLKGLMSELFLSDLAQKTRRGQSARVREGKSGGGMSYGYQPDPAQKGNLLIVPAEAATVRRIFASYVAGDAPRAIAAALNSERIPSPRGGRWNASTINGSRLRQNGILQNRLYAGEIVWNRQRFIKDPATGRRVSRLNDESAWQRAPAPHLAIVDRDLFDAAQHAKAARGGPRATRPVPPKHLLSGLIKCGCCGASYTVIGPGRLGCAGFRERGDCTNRRTVSRQHVEERVLIALRERLLAPEMIAEFVKTYREEMRRLRAQHRDDREAASRRLTQLAASIERTVDLIVNGDAPAPLLDRLRAMEAERATLTHQLATAPAGDAPVELHPAAAGRYRKIVEDLQGQIATLERGAPADTLIREVRGMIARIDVFPPPKSKEPVELKVHGLLAQLLMPSSGTPAMYGPDGCGDLLRAVPHIEVAA